jgi:endo-alpha-1,4-polygalactosaminidase (GH114 family)
MTSDAGRRWRALRTWFDAFPPDDQERLLGQMERLLALGHDRDMGAFLDWVDEWLDLIERHEPRDPQASEQERRGREDLQP